MTPAEIVAQIEGLAHKLHQCDEGGCGYTSQAVEVITTALARLESEKAALRMNLQAAMDATDRHYAKWNALEQEVSRLTKEKDAAEWQVQRLANMIETEWKPEVSRLRAALRLCLDWILLGNHEEAPGWIEARDAAQSALESRP